MFLEVLYLWGLLRCYKYWFSFYQIISLTKWKFFSRIFNFVLLAYVLGNHWNLSFIFFTTPPLRWNSIANLKPENLYLEETIKLSNIIPPSTHCDWWRHTQHTTACQMVLQPVSEHFIEEEFPTSPSTGSIFGQF